ncbi:MAG: PhoH family protein [Lentisphaerae bacterium]|nr:PhoH family protein [Lentisphaerota bacterium]
MAIDADTKTFVLDTNVLLHSAQSIESFQDHDVVIPMAVIEELDKFKKNSDELGRNARRVIRTLDRLRELTSSEPGSLRLGVKLNLINPTANGRLFVLSAPNLSSDDPVRRSVDNVFGSELDLQSPDNRILRIAALLKNDGRDVVFISKDINLRLKADALGLKVMDYERGKVNNDSLYTGFATRSVDDEQINLLYRDRQISIDDPELLANQFLVLNAQSNPKHSALCRYDAEQKNIRLVSNYSEGVWNILPRNKEQKMAFDLLLDPDIQLVTLIGGAGTGKTLLALAAGLQQVLNSQLYDKISVSRPIVPLGNDIGFLPGSKDAKLSTWMQPIFDNLDLLLSQENEKKNKSSSRYSSESLQNMHKLELEALTYIRGRSIQRQYVIIDEAQNLTPHEVKTIISRCGNDTKMILTGDPYQIDNPYLDASSNGLCYTVEKLKGENIFGHITLAKSERGKLAALAAKKL